MSKPGPVAVKDLSEGDYVEFDVDGEAKRGEILGIREWKDKMRFDVELPDGGFMTREHDPDDTIKVLGDEAREEDQG
jgi:hypothetical protein